MTNRCSASELGKGTAHGRAGGLVYSALGVLIMRGPVARFGLILALLLFLALVAGLVIRQLVPGFDSLGDAVWWAFEHVVVPEYVDGDEGVTRRTVATALIVLGSILFAGVVIAILVQWLEETTARLELGLTPVALDAHVVLLGWTSRTPDGGVELNPGRDECLALNENDDLIVLTTLE